MIFTSYTVLYWLAEKTNNGLGLVSVCENEVPAEKTDSGLSLAKCGSEGECNAQCDMNLGVNSANNVQMQKNENTERIKYNGEHVQGDLDEMIEAKDNSDQSVQDDRKLQG